MTSLSQKCVEMAFQVMGNYKIPDFSRLSSHIQPILTYQDKYGMVLLKANRGIYDLYVN
jgi:hypothetical protein